MTLDTPCFSVAHLSPVALPLSTLHWRAPPPRLNNSFAGRSGVLVRHLDLLLLLGHQQLLTYVLRILADQSARPVVPETVVFASESSMPWLAVSSTVSTEYSELVVPSVTELVVPESLGLEAQEFLVPELPGLDADPSVPPGSGAVASLSFLSPVFASMVTLVPATFSGSSSTSTSSLVSPSAPETPLDLG